MANLLTGLRLLLIFPFTLGLALPALFPGWLLSILIILAVLTDYFDGKVARKLGTASAAGQLFDHATDFLFVTCGLAGAAWSGSVPFILPVLIVIAFAQYVLDSHFLYRQKDLRMSFIGRWNGIFYFLPLILLSISRLDFPDELIRILLVTIRGISIVLIVSTVVSILDRSLAPLRHKSG